MIWLLQDAIGATSGHQYLINGYYASPRVLSNEINEIEKQRTSMVLGH